jgi:hypothetical protein
MKRIISHISPGIIIGLIALIIALAGTAVALPGSKLIDKNDYKKKSVTTRALARGAVTEGKLADDAVGASKLGNINTRTASTSVIGGTFGDAIANCQAGERVISGGSKGPGTFPLVSESHKQGEGWQARVYNNTGTTATLTVEAYCLAP